MNGSKPDPKPAVSDGAVSSSRLHFLRQVFRLVGPYWNCKQCMKARSAILLLFVLTVAQVALAVWVNYWNRAVFDALEQHSVKGVVLMVAVFALIFVITIVVTAAHLMVKRWIMIDWRAWLTNQLMGSWMESGHHYRLHFGNTEIDNPDQRIAEDIHIATEVAVTLAHTLTYSLLTLGLFIDILWSVSGTVSVPGTHFQIKGYMVPLAFIYAALGSTIGWVVGRPLVRATNALQAAEATFRFGLSMSRENTEAIALMHGEPMERVRASTLFTQIIRSWNRQSFAYMGLVSFGAGYGALLPVFPILIAAPQYIQGAMSLGVLMQAAQAFQQLTSALSWPVDNIGDIARCRASAERVLALHESMQEIAADKQKADDFHIATDRLDRSHLIIENLCIAKPSDGFLLEHFSADIRHGERVLITGDPEVTGSFFKVISGLWPWGSGRVRLPSDDNMLFVAQRPFLPEGVLRETLCYPSPPDAFPAPALRHSLECAGLAWLASRLDEKNKWGQVLPLPAQQRFSLARVLLQRPAWVFLEEAIDAFDPKGEQLLLEMLFREIPNATILNISFHPGLGYLHNRSLVLNRSRP